MAAVMLIVGCLSCYRQTKLELDTAIAEKEAEAARVDNLRIETLRTAAQIERLKTDPRAVEALARQNLGFVRRGEIVLRIIPDSNSPEDSVATADPTGEQAGGAQPSGRPRSGAGQLGEQWGGGDQPGRQRTGQPGGQRLGAVATDAVSSDSNPGRVARHSPNAVPSKKRG